jgi:acyl transferase domain-containing protein/3-hydroxymyristoyl/3-hydroxydecanoyl-(acyl carrier protein) dehydratase
VTTGVTDMAAAAMRVPPFMITGLAAFGPDAPDLASVQAALATGERRIRPAKASDLGVPPERLACRAAGVTDRVSCLEGAWIGSGAPHPDPQDTERDATFTWTLHLAGEALADARRRGGRLPPLDHVGLICGLFSWGATGRSRQSFLADYLERLDAPELPERPPPGLPENARIAGWVPLEIGRRIGLGGPCMALDAACATGLYALKLAQLYLRAGITDAMVVVSANATDPVFGSLGFSALQAIPSEGRESRPLDADTDGLALGLGGVGCLIEPVAEDAAPRAVVRSIGLASDGRGQPIVAPNPKGQRLALERAHAEAGLQPAAIDWIEAHATGTKLGDATELAVLTELFEEDATPIGAAKAGLGHWLPAAGLLSVVKAVTAFEREEVPATPGLRRPADSRVLAAPRPWRRSASGQPRRMAIDSFGFGGTDAHAILEAPEGRSRPAAAAAIDLRAPTPLVVLGMEAIDGAAVGLAEVVASQPEPSPKPLGPVVVDAKRLRLPPRELAKLPPGAPLMQAVADAALRRAGLAEGGRVAVIVAMEADLAVHRLMARWEVQCQLAGQVKDDRLQALKDALSPATDAAGFLGWIGNLLASRIAHAWDFNGPNFTVSAEGAGVSRALELADLLLRAGEAEAVVVGAVEIGSRWESTLQANRLAAAGLAPPPRRDSAAALVLATPDHPLAAAREVARLPSAACEGNVKSDGGSREVAAPLVRLVARLAAAASGRRLESGSPILPGPAGAPRASLADPALPWAVDEPAEATLAPRPRAGLGGAAAAVLPVVAPSPNDVGPALDRLAERLDAGECAGPDGLVRLAVATLDELAKAPACATVIALVARNPVELRREIAWAREGVGAALAAGERWRSPLGSAATARPVGDQPIAFLYPGIAHLLVGSGGDFMALAPDRTSTIARRIGGLEHALAADRLFPAYEADPETRERLAEFLASDPRGLIAASACLCSIAEAGISALLGRLPAWAAGHSLGEIGMLLAHDVWRADRAFLDRLDQCRALTHGLSGPRLAVAQALGIRTAASWETRLIMAAPDVVEAAHARLPPDLSAQVWLTHRNAPQEVIIAGLAPAVEALCEGVGADFVAGPPGPAIHCPAAGRAADDLIDLLAPLGGAVPAARPSLRLTAAEEPLRAEDTIDRHDLARRVVEGFSRPCDAVAMIERLYDDGARVFIEVGPSVGIPRWTAATLGRRPHLAVASERRGSVPGHALAALVAQLLAHRVPFDRANLLAMLERDLTPLADPPRVPVTIERDPNPIRKAPPVGAGQLRTVASVAERSPSGDPRVAATLAEGIAPAGAGSTADNVVIGLAEAHRAFLSARRRALAAWRGGGPATDTDAVSQDPPRPLFGPEAVRSFAEGRLAPVLGAEGAWIDRLPRRLRLPAPPFLALDRVLSIERPPNGLAPARIVTEHDIPDDAGFDVDGQPPYLALDAQGILVLLSVLGIDRHLRGERVYRWLDGMLTYRGDAPRCGEMVRYEITLERAVADGDSLMVFATFHASVKGRPVLEIERCAAGFFTDAELERGQALPPATPQRLRGSLLSPLAGARRLPSRIQASGLAALAAGEVELVFGSDAAPGAALHQLRLPPQAIRMLDRVTRITPAAGAPGLGVFEAEKDLDPADWYLKAHFIGDPVFAGPCMIEGSLQLLRIVALAYGLAAGAGLARFEPVAGLPLAARFRGQVPGNRRSVFTYSLTVTGLGRTPVPWIVADVDLLHEGRITGRLTGVALQIVEDGQTIRWQPARAPAAAAGGMS